MQVPHITKEHMEKATNSFKWDERYSVDICNKAIEIALAEQSQAQPLTTGFDGLTNLEIAATVLQVRIAEAKVEEARLLKEAAEKVQSK